MSTKPKGSPPKPVYWVSLGGKKRPVRFGMFAIGTYNELTNTTLADFQAKLEAPPEVQAEYKAALEEDREPDITWMPAFNGKDLIALVYAGLEDGAAKEGQPFDASFRGVSYWMDESPDEDELIPTVFKALMGAQADVAKPDDDEGAEGKAVAKEAA